MIKLSKPFYSNLLICATYCLILFTPIQVIAGDQLFNSSNKSNSDAGKKMKNMHWDTPDPKPEEVTKSEGKTATEEETSPEEDMWEKYKELAAGTKAKETTANEENTTTEKASKGNATPDKKHGGLTAIIDDYKNAQESKGKMNSRSFGSID